jgi:hypothetical protein
MARMARIRRPCFPRTGAFVAGLPVQPVLFTYRWKNRNPNFTGSLLSTTFELMTSWMNYMEVLELPVHYPTTLEQADARVFADNMQQIVSNGEPREEHLAAGCTRLFACLPACLPDSLYADSPSSLLLRSLSRRRLWWSACERRSAHTGSRDVEQAGAASVETRKRPREDGPPAAEAKPSGADHWRGGCHARWFWPWRRTLRGRAFSFRVA